jgi:hypothetical protein
LGFATQGQLQQVFLNACFDGFAQLGLDLEEAVRRAKPFNALIGPLVVVVFDPELDPFSSRFETVELGPHQKLLPDGGPEPFDLAQSHGMLWPTFEVGDVIFFEFSLETTDPTPRGVLTTVVGEHLFGRLILTDGHPVHFNHRVGRWAAEQVGPNDEPRVIVHEGDEIGVTAT